MPSQITVTVRGVQEPSAAIHLPTLLRTLGALQKMALQVGAMLADTNSRRSRGEFSSAVRSACELIVTDLRPGSATAVVEFPSPSQPPLLAEFSALGERSLHTISRLAHCVTNGASWEEVHAILPDEAHRRLILKTCKHLCPTSSEGVVVSLTTPATDSLPFAFSSATRARVQVLAAQTSPQDVLEERQLVGRLVMLRSRPPSFEVKQAERSFTCPYDPDLEEGLLDLYDAMVCVRGVCRVIKHDDRDDEVLELLDIGEVTYLDESPLTITEVALPAGPLALAAPFEVLPDFSDNLVAFAHEPLHILAYGDTRDEAEAAFRDELAWLWAEYAHASDETLAPGARRLKATLLAVQQGGDA